MTIQKGSILDQGPGQLGGRARMSPALTRDTLLRLEAENKSEPTLVTLTLDYKVVRDDVAGAVPNVSNHLVVAEIFWGSIKGRGSALIDVKHGVRVSLEASIIGVNALYLQANPAAAFVGPTVDIFASVGEGSIGNSAGPLITLTGNSVAVNAGGNFTWNVPDYAYAVEIQSDAEPTIAIPNGFLVNLLANPNPAAGRLIGRLTGTNNVTTLPNGCEAINLVNAGPGNQIYTPVFHLDL